jgi:hypothetical protein
MATYQLVGSQDPASRIDRVEVESPSEEYPEGKILELHGAPQELSDEQYSKLSRYVRLQPVKADAEAEVHYVDQPGVKFESLSTDSPPDPGTAPEVGSLNKEELVTELERVQAEGHLQDVSPKANKDELAKALREYHGQEA